MNELRDPVLPRPRHFVQFGPHNDAHLVAFRAALSVAIPLVVLWASGHIDLSIYAAFGAFTSIYGRTHTHRSRMRMQLGVGTWLTVAVTIGATVAVSSAREWLVIPVVAICTAAASFLSDSLHWHPPGPLFTVFAVAACASVPTGFSQIPVAFAVAGGSALLSVIIGGIGHIHPRARRAPQTPLPISFHRAWARPDTLAHMARFATAVVIAGVIPTATGLGHPYWAMVAAVAATSGFDTTSRLVRGGHRVLGTIAGVLVSGIILAFEPTVFVTILIVIMMQAGAELFINRNYGIALLFVTPLSILMVELAHHTEGTALLRDRALETVLGAVVGIGVTVAAHHRERGA